MLVQTTWVFAEVVTYNATSIRKNYNFSVYFFVNFFENPIIIDCMINSCFEKRHISGLSGVGEEIKSIALAVLELCLCVSRSVSRKSVS